ncbi:MAG: hypothetical protein ACYDHH_14170, partial [Solirubrobacteraceae bacterium]
SAAAPSSVELPLIAAAPGTAPALVKTGNAPLGCPSASGALTNRGIGPVTLGMTRAQAERAVIASSTRGHANMEVLCLTPSGIRVGYPSAKLLRSLPRRVRAAVKGRVVLALTANRYYSLQGIRPGTPFAKVHVQLVNPRGYKIGRNTWYVSPYVAQLAAAFGVFKVQHGIVEEVGIASEPATFSRQGLRFFLASFAG